jgi:hypothetical protein
MAIDDPLEAFDQQYMREEPDLPNKLAKFFGETGAKLAFPHGGFVLEAMQIAAHALFDRASTEERIKQMWDMTRKELERVERTKATVEDVARAIQLSVWYDHHERDDKKRERYVKLIGNASRSETKVEDITTFIQTIEQLNERDVIVLRVLNKVMNKVGDWKPATTTAGTATIHPNNFIHRAQELSFEIAVALRQNTDTSTFSREEGYGVCNRLQGFGLAHEIDTQQRELPLTNYCFRLSVQGVQLLKLLGEDVPNYEYYLSKD